MALHALQARRQLGFGIEQELSRQDDAVAFGQARNDLGPAFVDRAEFDGHRFEPVFPRQAHHAVALARPDHRRGRHHQHILTARAGDLRIQPRAEG
ncbi:hypothetical protein FU658_06350 [Alkalisalibacterium limincola]|uniref:Uncharacterized protein n=1 Tax=Alkalisalibacterium limincola TaxID=2699169 RepID=A0A5C8KVX9_9GAMM|nr:hypothetical protein FU658_06350 [Alkalisalibacterium limincola]